MKNKIIVFLLFFTILFSSYNFHNFVYASTLNPVYTFSDGTTLEITDSIKTLLSVPIVSQGMKYSKEANVLSLGLQVYNDVQSKIDMPKSEKDAWLKSVAEGNKIKFQPWVYDLYNSIADRIFSNPVQTQITGFEEYPYDYNALPTDVITQYGAIMVQYNDGVYKGKTLLYYHYTPGYSLLFDSTSNSIKSSSSTSYAIRTLTSNGWSSCSYNSGGIYVPLSNNYASIIWSTPCDGVTRYTVDYTNDILKLVNNFDYSSVFPLNSTLSLKTGVTAANLVSATSLEGLADVEVPSDIPSETLPDTEQEYWKSILSKLGILDTTLKGLLEKAKNGELTREDENVLKQSALIINSSLSSKLGIPPRLTQSLDRIKNMNTSRGESPKIKINLWKIYNAATSRFGARNPFSNEEKVIFDFESINQFVFFGMGGIEWLRMLIGAGWLWKVGNYIWNRITPNQAIGG